MRKLKIVAMAMGILLLAGCENKPADKAGEVGKENKSDVTTETKAEKGGVISSIKDAMGLGKEMKCAYKFKGEAGDITSTAYVNGKKYKAESTVMGKKQIVIFDETAMYSWAEGEKTGMKMTKTCMEEMEKNIPKTQGGQEPASDSISDEEFFENSTDVSCMPYSGADFSVPKDITFADQCEMLKNIMNNSMPAGANIPSGVNIPQLP
ncbi:MAG: hypothetical protein US30_C0027G0004 [Candidatus Moranbacteria bacterium GW2011_GWF2_36_839]|nr:MAG: hypothetical protein US27_C0024G0004 [Candidatus Moranbacteria bacterium GW2011_GWF1_36_78]KKQ15864.1 MAG: hypothetical protein US30_C0027G0004 [Candidatus Moranbacteria bacterium GW2011_GWF2_36_839]HAT74411.1 hypothetical protein [Candidatus Moranbacteria bacterium]HBY11102.1 hypothetical protein [Candidatus Moranbacteria bacterium]